MNHDALFKLLMKTHSVLEGFFQAFLPETARFVDFRRLEFVDKELFSLDGKKRTGDLLINTQFRCRLLFRIRAAERRGGFAIGTGNQ